MRLLYNIDFDIAATFLTIIILYYHCFEFKQNTVANWRFRINAIGILVAIIFDIVASFMISNIEDFPPLLTVLANSVYYSAMAYIAFSFSTYISLHVVLGKSGFMEKRLNILILSLYIFSLIINLFTGLYFYVDSNHIYYHGPLFAILNLIPMYYVIYSTIRVVTNCKNIKPRKTLTILLFFSMLCIADLLQIFIFPNILLVLFVFSIGNLLILFAMETPDYYKLMETLQTLEQTNAKLEDARLLAEASSTAKTVFLTRMSHEIRTPINAIMGMNEMILRENNNENITNYSTNIHSSSMALLSIVNDVLDLSRIESGKMEIINNNYKLSALIKSIETMISIRAAEKGLDFKIDIETFVPDNLIGDIGRLRQVLLNLLSNAVKYTPKGTVTLSVSTVKPALNNKVVLNFSVKDSGIGIKEEDLPKIFDSFTRVDEKRNQNIEGSGLGLSITANLLSLMNSELKVSSVYGLGSNFYFDLEQELSTVSDTSDVIKESAPLICENATFIIVDDNNINLLVASKLLERTKATVDTAMSGNECIEKIKLKKYDIIFMDYMMPEKDGIETFHEIRETDSPNQNTPVVALTANAIAGAREKFLQEGFNYFLPKPIIPKDLENTIKKILEN